jgi:ribosomal protein S18 acetylase RimI-like enzyme
VHIHERKPTISYELPPVAIRKMTADDLTFCNSLVKMAGWNQLGSDWLRAMELEPHGCFVAETDGLPVATTTCCCFEQTGWIAMVLVDEKVRGKGIAKYLVEHAIAYLDNKGIKTIRLDATSLGKGLYKKLGFKEEYELTRYSRSAAEGVESSRANNLPVDSDNLARMIALDGKVTGSNRTSFIHQLVRERPSPFYCSSDKNVELIGYAGSRDGNTAIQIGPAIALTSEAGTRLLEKVMSNIHDKNIYIDIPVDNIAAVSWAETNGFKEQRRFLRMYRGDKINDLPNLIWASSGPEKG